MTVCATGHQAALLQSSFPDLQIEEGGGFPVRLGKYPILNLLRDTPLLVKSIHADRRWLHAYVKKHPVDLVVSDNRFGFHHPDIPSVYITHQLFPKLPHPWKGFSKRIARYHARYHQPFTEIWIPDMQREDNVSGELSRSKNRSFEHIRHIGLLSRMACEQPEKPNPFPGYQQLAILSGPEPARTNFERIVMEKFRTTGKPGLIVRGIPGSEEVILDENVLCIPHLEDAILKPVLENARLVICRAGFSSIMDLLALHKPALLVPTPGQTEQEYLAQRLSKMKWFETATEDQIGNLDSQNINHLCIKDYGLDINRMDEIDRALDEIEDKHHARHPQQVSRINL